MAVDLVEPLQRAIVKVCELPLPTSRPGRGSTIWAWTRWPSPRSSSRSRSSSTGSSPSTCCAGSTASRPCGDVAAELAGGVGRGRASSAGASSTPPSLKAGGTSPAAIARHYDLSDEFFALLARRRTCVYSCALWGGDDRGHACARPSSASSTTSPASSASAAARVLDVGCGWGALLDRFVRAHGAAGGVGLTLSPAQVGVRHGPRRARCRLPAGALGRPRAGRAVRRHHLHRGDRALRLRRRSTPTPRSRSTGPSSTAAPAGCGRAGGSACS